VLLQERLEGHRREEEQKVALAAEKEALRGPLVAAIQVCVFWEVGECNTGAATDAQMHAPRATLCTRAVVSSPVMYRDNVFPGTHRRVRW